MLALQTRNFSRHEVIDDLGASDLPADVIWIDLLNGTPDEIAYVERATGLTVPSFEALGEIEHSSRLAVEDGVFYLSTPVTYRPDGLTPLTTPVGFILSKDFLVTIRFEQLPAFATFKERVLKSHVVHPNSYCVFGALMETVVDRIADVLESVGTELDDISHRVFRPPAKGGKHSRRHADEQLRRTVNVLGRAGDLLSKLRDSLLGIGRIVPYVSSLSEDIPQEAKPMMKTLRQDITSLNDYDAHLNTKVQFLLDATLGLINIEQNNIMKVLTIVSIVGIPPTLFAGIYGMNFKYMPELNWEWGYGYGWAVIVISAIIPFVWLKLRGWF
jgi:magnesium transporter